jgi:hypothetical protein
MLGSKEISALALWVGMASVSLAQTTPASPGEQTPPADQSAPAPQGAPATPAITGPLQQSAPLTFDAGPLGKLSLNGILTGMGMWTGNHIASDSAGQADLSNGQIFLQKTDGWWQFYIQAGAYNIASLGVPYLDTKQTMSNLFGPVPVAFLKLAPGKNTSILVGALPTMIGAEYTFSFENMNLTRGLLWNQENLVNRGIQINQTMGKFTASLSWNDGFYSNRYSWVTGSLAYTNGAHSLSFVAGGNAGQTAYQTYATPVQNNSTIYNVIYTYNKAPWIIQPYWQYTNVPTNARIGISKGASTQSGAILVSRTFKHGFSLPFRWEYIATSGSAQEGSVNLLFGPGSSATSFTVTPTWQKKAFFIRGDLSWLHAMSYAPGSAFGGDGRNADQPRAMIEFGFLFGSNIEGH